MFKINPFLTPDNIIISPTNTKLYGFENQVQGHCLLMVPEIYCMNH